jgi:hypothetical protein
MHEGMGQKIVYGLWRHCSDVLSNLVSKLHEGVITWAVRSKLYECGNLGHEHITSNEAGRFVHEA